MIFLSVMTDVKDIKVNKFVMYVQLLTVEFAVDLGSGLLWGKSIVLCDQKRTIHIVHVNCIFLSEE